jgi:uncharacterized protein (TIGR02265 family)
MAQEKMVFSNAIDLLFNVAHKKQLNAEIETCLLQLGINLKKPLPAYTLTVFVNAIEKSGPLLYPGSDVSSAARKMGAAIVNHADSNLIGKAVMSMAKLVGPRRIIPKLKNSWRAANNYTEVEVKELSEKEFLITFNEPGTMQWYSLGSLEAGFTLIAGKDAKVTIDSATPVSATYRLCLS